MSTLLESWDNDRSWPLIAYIETTNKCNAMCNCCLNHRCKRVRGVMTVEDFTTIAHKLKANSIKIGAMFCFGEPLMDPTLTDKFRIAKDLGLLAGHVGFNTNVSLLTPDRYDGLLNDTPNIILSFFNTGEEFEDITQLSWDLCYNNALNFIRYRDKVSPSYPIFIGCNTVKGHNLANVKEAFKGCNVTYVQDAELRWGGSVITGVLDRMIMFNQWRCDGLKGALQIKYNGDCEFCAYDIIGSPEGGETKFGNILTDSIPELREKFVAKWKEPCSLCARCDYYHHCNDVLVNGFKKPCPLPDDWYDWQDEFLQEGEEHID